MGDPEIRRDPGTNGLQVTSVAFTKGSRAEWADGLLGFVTVILNDTLLLGGIAVRRTLDGRYTLSFPKPRGRSGVRHGVARPLDDAARQHLEREIFKALRCEDSEVSK